MTIKLIVIGKTNVNFVKEGFNEYQQRLKHYTKFEYIELSDVKKQPSKELLKRKEGEKLLAKCANTDFVVLLDEKGKEFSSVAFARQLEKWQLQGITSVVFAIGGAFGFSEEVYRRANLKLSLSKMTFSHQMIRLLFVEQLYRSFTIIRGEKYHHE